MRRNYLPVCGHQHFNVSSRIETIQLVDELQHCSLHLVVATGTIVKPSTTDSVDFVEENDARLLTPRHLEELTDHPCTLTDIFLHELRTYDTDKCCICPVRHSTCTERLASTRGTEEQNALWRVNTKVDKAFRLRKMSV